MRTTNRRWLLAASGFIAMLLGVCAAAADTGQIDALLRQLEQVHDFSSVSVSPDGKWVTWTQAVPGSSSETEIYILDRSNPSAKPQRLSAGNGSQSFEESNVSWSPDSSEIAFLSNAVSPQRDVFVISANGGKARKITSLHGYATDIRWSPDGKQIAILYAENGGGGGPLQAAPSQTGVIEADIHNQRIAVVNAGGGDLTQLSPADLNIYEYDWSPDGNRFAAIAAPGPADNNWWSAQLYLLDVHSKRMQSLYQPPKDRQLAVPRWSPDGNQIAFIGGIMSDEGFTGGDIFTVPGNGGEARNLTPNRAASPNGIHWQSPDRMVFTEALNGGGAISTLNLTTGQTETLWKGDQNLHQDGNYPNFFLARDGRTSALIRNTWEHSPDIWAGRIGEWQQITHQNAEQKPHWGKAESLMWTNEGLRAQGWLLYPENYDASKRYPMIVQIHGGPAGLKSAAWPSPRFDMSVMAGLGYFVFFPNPRGSFGEGEAFTKANIRDFGGGDLRDILAGVDAVVKKVSVDDQRIGVTGWSYGGYMTMWTVTQTNRFRAAVAGAGLANWQSYYGENLIDKWMIPFFGASVYDDPAVYAKSSPITFIKQVKTPTLVVVGERDAECPSPQSFEFWHALKTLGVRTELVVYPGEGHAFHEPKNRSDVLRRTLAWFDEYLGTGQEQSKVKGN